MLEALQFRQCVLIGPLGKSDATLQAVEYLVAGREGFAQGHTLGAIGTQGVVFPELGFSAEEAAQGPLAAQHRIELESLFGCEGLEASQVFVLELGELATIFAGNELRFRVEAGFEGIL